jgi:hypothetical protein
MQKQVAIILSSGCRAGCQETVVSLSGRLDILNLEVIRKGGVACGKRTGSYKCR